MAGYNVGVGASSSTFTGQHIQNRWFLCLGQSNMVGQGIISGADTTNADIYMLHSDDSVTEALEPIENNDNETSVRQGFLLAFGREYVENYTSSQCYFAMSAKSSTSFGAGEWVKGGDRYNSAVSTFNRAKAIWTDIPFGGILWHQGESDCTPAYSDSYQENLTQFVSDLRADIGEPNAPFVAGQLADGWVDENNYRVNEPILDRRKVQRVLRDVAKYIPNSVTVSALGLDQDNTHFYATGNREFGPRYYEAWKTLI